jgi:hypothetical protein
MVDVIQQCLERIQPKQFMVYSGPPGRKIAEQLDFDGEIITLPNYVEVRRKIAFGKNQGMQGLSSKNRAKALTKARKKVRAGLEKDDVPQVTQDDDLDD